MSRAGVILSIAVTLLGAAPASAQIASLSPVGTFSQPVYVTSDPAAPDRIFVVQRAGLIMLRQAGVTSTFADLTSVVDCCPGERGLFSMAFAPDYSTSGLFYVYYTGTDGPGNIHIDELRATGDSASIATLRNVLTIPHPSAFHNGGHVQFGPDGYLYVSTGDGATGGAPARNLGSLLGKVLRIDPRQAGTAPYTVPTDNPFFGATPGLDEIWSYGLRNPWRFSFDRATGDLLIADVGESAREEVDYAPASDLFGKADDFGWNCREGLIPYSAAPASCIGQMGFTDPIFDYPHTNPGGGQAYGCSITGGYVVRDPGLGALNGRYLYADLCVGRVRSLIPGLPAASDDRPEAITVFNPATFGEDSCGRLYVASLFNGVVSRIVGTSPVACAVLRVTVAGGGSGSVTGPGIDCPGDCLEVFQAATVELTADPGADSYLAGWSGDCSGTGRCALSMDADRNVVATFAERQDTRVRLKAKRKLLERGDRARLRAKARPCPGRSRDPIILRRNGSRISKKRLKENCTAVFRPRVTHRSKFRAVVPGEEANRKGKSKAVRIRVKVG